MPDLLFYDGTCGLCHRAVTFALARDPDGSRFRFAALQGARAHRDPDRVANQVCIVELDARALGAVVVEHLDARAGQVGVESIGGADRRVVVRRTNPHQ